MEIRLWIEVIIRILAGLAIVIPLVIELAKAVGKDVKEQNWNVLIGKVLGLMVVAEKKFADGASRKEWVMTAVAEIAKTLVYDYDEVAEHKVSEMIDEICETAKIVNA